MLFKFLIGAFLFVSLVFLVQPVFAQGPDSSPQPCTPNEPVTGRATLCNPIQGVGDLKSLAIKLITIFAGFATLIPIVAVTFAGFSMVVSQGNEEAITRAKTALTWAVLGFILAILAFALVAAMINFLGAWNLGTQFNPTDPQGVIVNPISASNFVIFVWGMITRFLQVVGVVAVLMLIFSGFRYITSMGNEEQATEGKKGIQWVVIGIVVILFSYVIIKASAALFGIS